MNSEDLTRNIVQWRKCVNDMCECINKGTSIQVAVAHAWVLGYEAGRNDVVKGDQ